MGEATRRSRKASVPTVARHGRLRRSRVSLAILKLVGIVTAVAVVSVGSIAAIAAWDLSRQISTVDIPEDVAGAIPEIGPYSGGFNMLLVGSDSRANSVYSYGEDPESELNDVNILLHVSADHTNAIAVSFPRDLRVAIPECSDGEGGTNGPAWSQKINTALMYGGGLEKDGLSCVVETVSDLTGLSIPFAATISFDGVIEMSNAIGGVDVCIATHLQDENTELDLLPGTHTLQGMDALKFLRTRYGVGDGSDVTRISSQQVFLSSLVRKVKSTETLSDIGKLYGLAGAAVRNMKFSSSLNNIDQIVSIARALQPVDVANIAFVQYPSASDGDNGLEPIEDSAAILMQAISTDQPVIVQPPSEDQRTGSVADTSADPLAEAPVTEPDEGEEATGEVDATPGGAVVLPDDVSGQSAAETRCTVGRSLDDQ